MTLSDRLETTKNIIAEMILHCILHWVLPFCSTFPSVPHSVLHDVFKILHNSEPSYTFNCHHDNHPSTFLEYKYLKHKLCLRFISVTLLGNRLWTAYFCFRVLQLLAKKKWPQWIKKMSVDKSSGKRKQGLPHPWKCSKAFRLNGGFTEQCLEQCENWLYQCRHSLTIFQVFPGLPFQIFLYSF